MRNPLDLLYRIRRRLSERSVVRNVYGSPSNWPKALLHYKTGPLFDPRLVERYTHTNNWEIVEICNILHGIGFQVDVVDRAEVEWEPRDDYALLLGDAGGRSGWRFPHYAACLPSAWTVFYAVCPEPTLTTALTVERYAAFEARTGVFDRRMRIPDNNDIEASMARTDAIICMDGNGFSSDSYARFDLPVFNVRPSTSPVVRFDVAWMESRDRRSFLCFVGDGFVAKGVDLVVEAFARMPDLTLHIAGPDSDEGFWRAYAGLIESSSNIVYEGFLPVGGRRFRELCDRCSFVILPSAIEGCCTSVATAMRAGLPPITTFATCVDDGSAGFLLQSTGDGLIEEIKETALFLSKMDGDEYRERVTATLETAESFSQDSFTSTFSQALMGALRGSGIEATLGR